MLIKFESKSNRVKGVSFHPKRPWILASLHNGCVQLWDYRMGTLIEKFEEHEGPVRGVAFHPTQPLFVSGGDDYKIKVWNYKQRRCLFTLTGHLDYIRTVFFHHEHPWIVSAADDQTIRIWNWQSRQCISVLTGHNHYVMCAQFHPKEDLVVSASLDQTVRVWDISGLRKKNLAPKKTFPEDVNSIPARNPISQGEMFGNTDVLVKYVLEGHERGVNWVSFHPNLPLIVSGADDRQVKLWRMSDTKAWEVDTLRGHYNNVSCAIFHPRQELIISNSEDKSIRIWDMTKRTGVQSFRRENDRFWIMTAHPEMNLFAAGHDNGLIVFKLERERPAFTLYQDSLFYVKDKYIRYCDLQTGADFAVLGIRRAVGMNMQHRSLSYSPAENAVLLTSPVDGGTYEIYRLPKELRDMGEPRDSSSDCIRGSGNGAIFVARNRYALLNKSLQKLSVRTLGSDSSRTIDLTNDFNDIFYAGPGLLLLVATNSVVLYDLQQESSVVELQIAGVKYVYWNSDMTLVALVSKHAITIADKNLNQLGNIHETIRIKSGAWDDCGIFVYSTLNHIKYALPQGDDGIIRTLDHAVYIARSHGKNIYCLDRDGKLRILTIEPTEYRFKLALVKKNYDEVLHIIRNSNLVGQSIIAYLRDKGYPEVALHFVREKKTRFDLALECGNLEVGLETAKEIDTEDCWAQLAEVALKHGNQMIMETAYQRIKNFDKLTFLYAMTGNNDKLKKMTKISELRSDFVSQFHNAIFLGDVQEQMNVLKTVAPPVLAYIFAKRHGLEEDAQNIVSASNRNVDDADRLCEPGRRILVPPSAFYPQPEHNWPLLSVSRGIFESGNNFVPPSANQSVVGTIPLDPAHEDIAIEGDWGMDEIPELADNATDGVPLQDAEENGWDLDDDLKLPELQTNSGANGDKDASGFVVPSYGMSYQSSWMRNSPLAVDQIAAGSFDAAMKILNDQAGICDFNPLKPFFMSIYHSSQRSISGLGTNISQISGLYRNWQEADIKHALPMLPLSLSSLVAQLQNAYQSTTSGRFSEALDSFILVLHSALFVAVSKRSEIEEIRQLIDICREYILGLKLELTRKELPIEDEAEQKRAVELAAYFTHCRLQSVHVVLSLRVAMTLAFKLKCFQTTTIFARRLLESGPSAQIAQQTRKVLAASEQAPRDEIQLNYDPLNPFLLCAETFTPIYKGSPLIQCPFCQASYQPTLEGRLCNICRVAKVGKNTKGMNWMVEQAR